MTNEVIFLGNCLNCGYKTSELNFRFNLSCFLRICAAIAFFTSLWRHSSMAAGSFLSCRGQNLPIHQLGPMTSQFINLACWLTSFLEHVSCILFVFCLLRDISSFLFTVWLFVFFFLILSHILESTHFLDCATLK